MRQRIALFILGVRIRRLFFVGDSQYDFLFIGRGFLFDFCRHDRKATITLFQTQQGCERVAVGESERVKSATHLIARVCCHLATHERVEHPHTKSHGA